VQDYIDVATDDGVRVTQTGTQQYMIHQFSDFAGLAQSATLTWNGQCTVSPVESIVKLQIYNYDTPGWEDVDSDNSADSDTDFTLEGSIPDLTNYKDAELFITCRVWQDAI